MRWMEPRTFWNHRAPCQLDPNISGMVLSCLQEINTLPLSALKATTLKEHSQGIFPPSRKSPALTVIPLEMGGGAGGSDCSMHISQDGPSLPPYLATVLQSSRRFSWAVSSPWHAPRSHWPWILQLQVLLAASQTLHGAGLTSGLEAPLGKGC